MVLLHCITTRTNSANQDVFFFKEKGINKMKKMKPERLKRRLCLLCCVISISCGLTLETFYNFRYFFPFSLSDAVGAAMYHV